MEVIYVLLAIIALGGIGAIVHIINYNRLQSKVIRIAEAESIIDEALRQRHDLIARFNNTIKSTIKIKDDYFKDFDDLEKENLSNFDLDRKITKAFNLALKLKNDYTELENDKTINDLILNLKQNAEKLEAAKAFYNKYTTELNKVIKKFPSNITARIHGFVVKAYYDGKDLEDNIIDDFKL